jgi:hypothetical protein
MGNIAATGPFDRRRVQPACVHAADALQRKKVRRSAFIVALTRAWRVSSNLFHAVINKNERRQHCCGGPATRRVSARSSSTQRALNAETYETAQHPCAWTHYPARATPTCVPCRALQRKNIRRSTHCCDRLPACQPSCVPTQQALNAKNETLNIHVPGPGPGACQPA